MSPTLPALNYAPCTVRHLRYSPPYTQCDRCGRPTRRVWEVSRTAIDINLEGPVLLLVTVSVHRCSACSGYFRAQPPFLRRNAIYAERVREKALLSVYEDGMPFRRVTGRLARDFWVKPSEAMIRRWCKDFAEGLAFEEDCEAWVMEEFSGILCVDEVYQDKLALLLAVDPATPGGDRLVGYELIHGRVERKDVEYFLSRLKDTGIEPEEIITDGSPLYPNPLKEVWPQAAHQPCLFHESRLVTAEIYKAPRRPAVALGDARRGAALAFRPLPEGTGKRSRARIRGAVSYGALDTFNVYYAVSVGRLNFLALPAAHPKDASGLALASAPFEGSD